MGKVKFSTKFIIAIIFLSITINFDISKDADENDISKFIKNNDNITILSDEFNILENPKTKIVYNCESPNVTYITPTEIKHYDHTTTATSHWHIETSGFNNYLWCGDVSIGSYGKNWNEMIYLSPNGNSSMDWSSDPNLIVIKFDSYEDFEGFPNDYGSIEINPHISESDSYWYTLSNYFLERYPFWKNYEIHATPEMFYCEILNNNLMNQEGGFTEDMGLRFRFKSDDFSEYEGWFLDNIELTGSNCLLYKINTCNNIENFSIKTKFCGDWWYENILSNEWICMNQFNNIIPNDVNNSLEMSLPKAIYNNLTFYHNYCLENKGDYCYLEIRIDGDNKWIRINEFTGIYAGIENINLYAFIGEKVIVRWRIKTNSTGFSNYYKINNILFTGELDSEPPITTVNLSGNKIRNWYSSFPIFELNSKDGVSGVAATYYRLNEGFIQTYYNPIVIFADGEHHIEYWSIDKVGNEEEHHITNTIKIDTTPPNLNILKLESGIYFLGKYIFPSEKTTIFGGFNFKAFAKDSQSDIFNVKFFLNDKEFFRKSKAPFIAYCSERHLGYGTIKVIAEDFAGNLAEDIYSLYYNKLF